MNRFSARTLQVGASQSRKAVGHRLVLVRRRESTSPRPELMRWGHPEPRLGSSHLVFDAGDAASDRLIWGVTRKIIQILENSPTMAIARRAYFARDHGNHLESSLSPLHDPSSPLRLPELHRQLLSLPRACRPERCLSQLHSRIYRDPSRPCLRFPAASQSSLLQIRQTRNSQKPPQ